MFVINTFVTAKTQSSQRNTLKDILVKSAIPVKAGMTYSTESEKY
jgi:uncharacterized protein involved in propanediol utilization